MLQAQPRIDVIDEPLHFLTVKRHLGPEGAKWRYFDDDGLQDQILRYFSDLRDGRLVFPGYRALLSPQHRIVADRTAFKILRASSMLPWFQRHFDGRYIILLRHPIPTALSRMANKWGNHTDEYLKSAYYRNTFLSASLIKRIESITTNGTELEGFVLAWCLDNLPLIRWYEEGRAPMITYEQFMADPADTAAAVAELLDLPDVGRILEQMRVPSPSTKYSEAGTRDDIARGNRERLLMRWRSRIGEDEEKRLFEIVAEFGIDLYRCGSAFSAPGDSGRPRGPVQDRHVYAP